MIFAAAALVILDIVLLIVLIVTLRKRRKKGIDEQGIHKSGTRYDDNGFDQEGYNASGFDRKGFDRQGYDRAGYDKAGFNRRGFNAKGYDVHGFNAQGYNSAGKNARGQYDRLFDRDAFAGENCSVEGFYPPRIYPISLTRHARERMQERMGLSRELDMLRLAEEAYRHGKSSRQVMRSVAARIQEKEQAHDDGIILLYRNYVYIFSQTNCLITLYPNEDLH